MKELLTLGPQIATLVPDVRFSVRVAEEKRKTGRSLLVISTHNQSRQGLELIREAYLSSMANGCISFPIPERSLHLYTRIGSEAFNFGHWGRFFGIYLAHFRQRRFRVPKSRALEVVLKLEPLETERLSAYVSHILRNRFRVIGKFDQQGTQFTHATLTNNRPTEKGKGHNCSSWIATAPLGPNNEPLLEILGGSRSVEVGTNPGWWTSWLAAMAPAERIPFVIHWTNRPMSEVLATEAISERRFPWDFNRQ